MKITLEIETVKDHVSMAKKAIERGDSVSTILEKMFQCDIETHLEVLERLPDYNLDGTDDLVLEYIQNLSTRLLTIYEAKKQTIQNQAT
jgi:hypothetical protein